MSNPINSIMDSIMDSVTVFYHVVEYESYCRFHTNILITNLVGFIVEPTTDLIGSHMAEQY